MKRKWRANLTFVQVCMTLAFKLVVSSKNFFKNAFVLRLSLKELLKIDPTYIYIDTYTQSTIHSACMILCTYFVGFSKLHEEV